MQLPYLRSIWPSKGISRSSLMITGMHKFTMASKRRDEEGVSPAGSCQREKPDFCSVNLFSHPAA